MNGGSDGTLFQSIATCHITEQKEDTPETTRSQTPRPAQQLRVTEDGRSLRVQTDLPHLVSLGGGRLSTAVTLLPLPEGTTRIGTARATTAQDIVLRGAGVQAQHCYIVNEDDVVSLHPLADLITVDGLRVTVPTRLFQGSMLCIGRSHYFRFNHPTEAQRMRNNITNSRKPPPGDMRLHSALRPSDIQRYNTELRDHHYEFSGNFPGPGVVSADEDTAADRDTTCPPFPVIPPSQQLETSVYDNVENVQELLRQQQQQQLKQRKLRREVCLNSASRRIDALLMEEEAAAEDETGQTAGRNGLRINGKDGKAIQSSYFIEDVECIKRDGVGYCGTVMTGSGNSHCAAVETQSANPEPEYDVPRAQYNCSPDEIPTTDRASGDEFVVSKDTSSGGSIKLDPAASDPVNVPNNGDSDGSSRRPSDATPTAAAEPDEAQQDALNHAHNPPWNGYDNISQLKEAIQASAAAKLAKSTVGVAPPRIVIVKDATGARSDCRRENSTPSPVTAQSVENAARAETGLNVVTIRSNNNNNNNKIACERLVDVRNRLSASRELAAAVRRSQSPPDQHHPDTVSTQTNNLRPTLPPVEQQGPNVDPANGGGTDPNSEQNPPPSGAAPEETSDSKAPQPTTSDSGRNPTESSDSDSSGKKSIEDNCNASKKKTVSFENDAIDNDSKTSENGEKEPEDAVHVECGKKRKFGNNKAACKEKPPIGKNGNGTDTATAKKSDKTKNEGDKKKDKKSAKNAKKNEDANGEGSEAKTETPNATGKISFFKSLLTRSRSPSPNRGRTKRSPSPSKEPVKSDDVAKRLSDSSKSEEKMPKNGGKKNREKKDKKDKKKEKQKDERPADNSDGNSSAARERKREESVDKETAYVSNDEESSNEIVSAVASSKDQQLVVLVSNHSETSESQKIVSAVDSDDHTRTIQKSETTNVEVVPDTSLPASATQQPRQDRAISAVRIGNFNSNTNVCQLSSTSLVQTPVVESSAAGQPSAQTGTGTRLESSSTTSRVLGRRSAAPSIPLRKINGSSGGDSHFANSMTRLADSGGTTTEQPADVDDCNPWLVNLKGYNLKPNMDSFSGEKLFQKGTATTRVVLPGFGKTQVENANSIQTTATAGKLERRPGSLGAMRKPAPRSSDLKPESFSMQQPIYDTVCADESPDGLYKSTIELGNPRSSIKVTRSESIGKAYSLQDLKGATLTTGTPVGSGRYPPVCRQIAHDPSAAAIREDATEDELNQPSGRMSPSSKGERAVTADRQQQFNRVGSGGRRSGTETVVRDQASYGRHEIPQSKAVDLSSAERCKQYGVALQRDAQLQQRFQQQQQAFERNGKLFSPPSRTPLDSQFASRPREHTNFPMAQETLHLKLLKSSSLPYDSRSMTLPSGGYAGRGVCSSSSANPLESPVVIRRHEGEGSSSMNPLLDNFSRDTIASFCLEDLSQSQQDLANMYKFQKTERQREQEASLMERERLDTIERMWREFDSRNSATGSGAKQAVQSFGTMLAEKRSVQLGAEKQTMNAKPERDLSETETIKRNPKQQIDKSFDELLEEFDLTAREAERPRRPSRHRTDELSSPTSVPTITTIVGLPPHPLPIPTPPPPLSSPSSSSSCSSTATLQSSPVPAPDTSLRRQVSPAAERWNAEDPEGFNSGRPRASSCSQKIQPGACGPERLNSAPGREETGRYNGAASLLEKCRSQTLQRIPPKTAPKPVIGSRSPSDPPPAYIRSNSSDGSALRGTAGAKGHGGHLQGQSQGHWNGTADNALTNSSDAQEISSSVSVSNVALNHSDFLHQRQSSLDKPRTRLLEEQMKAMQAQVRQKQAAISALELELERERCFELERRMEDERKAAADQLQLITAAAATEPRENEEDEDASDDVRTRSDAGKNHRRPSAEETASTTARPLTRYLPARERTVDLRQFVEAAGHNLAAQIHHVELTPTSCRGFLSKMGRKLRTWTRRWFVFDRTRRCLNYYPDKLESRAAARGAIFFQSIQDVFVDHRQTIRSPNPAATFCVKTLDRIIYLMAPTPEAMRIWIDVIFSGAEGYQAFL